MECNKHEGRQGGLRGHCKVRVTPECTRGAPTGAGDTDCWGIAGDATGRHSKAHAHTLKSPCNWNISRLPFRHSLSVVITFLQPIPTPPLVTAPPLAFSPCSTMSSVLSTLLQYVLIISVAYLYAKVPWKKSNGSNMRGAFGRLRASGLADYHTYRVCPNPCIAIILHP